MICRHRAGFNRYRAATGCKLVGMYGNVKIHQFGFVQVVERVFGIKSAFFNKNINPVCQLIMLDNGQQIVKNIAQIFRLRTVKIPWHHVRRKTGRHQMRPGFQGCRLYGPQLL